MPSDPGFVRRTLQATAIVVVAIAVCALAFSHPEVLLLAFGGILGAVLLDGLARPLRSLVMPRAAAIPLVVVVLLALAGSGAIVGGAHLVRQAGELAQQLPEAVGAAERTLAETALGRRALEVTEQASAGSPPTWERVAPYVFGSLAGIFTTALGAATAALAVFALAVFLALQPRRYVDAMLLLVPRARRRRLDEVLDAAARALRWWIVGRSIAMALVAALTAIGLALLGVDYALVLGLVAGILTFVPYVGPILSAVPALLVSLPAGVSSVLAVAALYTGVQLVENYLITPLVQGRTVSLPPALLIVAQVLLGVVLGGVGLVLATPLVVVFVVMVQALYVNDVLGERVPLLGEESGPGERRRAADPVRATDGSRPGPASR